MSKHEDILTYMNEMAAQMKAIGLDLEMPPKSVLTTKAEFTDFELGQSLTAKFPFNAEFTNPLKMLQGGFLNAYIDDVLGPLTYMASGRPMVTVEMSVSFIRPFVAADEFVVIKGEVISKSKSVLILKADVRTLAGKLIAIASQHALAVAKP